MKPLISILVANYNNGMYIAECLDSIAAQTYSPLEIIIVDDKSEDDSMQRIADYQQAHPELNIRIYQNDEHTCVGYIKHKCIELANGDYFLFLDPDDTLTPDAVEKLYKVHFNSSKPLSIVYATHYLCNEQLQPQSVSDYPAAIPDGQTHLTSQAGHISAPALCSSFLYTQTEKIGLRLHVAEDQDMYLKLEEKAPVRFVNEPLYYYRKHDHNISWSDDKRLVNCQYGLQVNIAAYKRRRGTTIPNLTFAQVQRMRMNAHLTAFDVYFKKRQYGKALGHYLVACLYCPFDKHLRLTKTIWHLIRK